ncbi:branched-chain amino acid ABC transporter permease [Pusillimonas sp. MFBS29]|uniref:branched-chain amino acid ABC transporter permease n=1 Tax=Pusillimonas sp. MFBS29 TaxID=2886690 RepID=UPI001D121FAB|nr:branched-chain amino acid ABC transporter permease [Pusillimonas sp. MFBS29]MCC2596993.1 branched-chain amino acid ABC transporter permease [Pusillimonas sp. MFBS29]
MTISAKYRTLIVLALIIALAPLFFPSAYYFRVGSTLFVNAIAVMGIVILTGYAGQISLGHAGFAGIGGYTCALAPVYWNVPPALAIVLGMLFSGVLAWLVGRPILRLKGYYLGVASLGFGILIGMTLNNERHLTKGPDGISVPDLGLRSLLKDWGLNLSNGEFWYAATGVTLLTGAWLAQNIRHSPTGRALRAVHGSEVAASTVGVDIAAAKLRAFVVSALYASVSGSLLALQNRFITPDAASFMHSIEMVTMAVLGGVGSVAGAVVGAGILTLLPQILTIFAEYQAIILGLTMMTVMIFLPQGLIPSVLRIFRGRRK